MELRFERLQLGLPLEVEPPLGMATMLALVVEEQVSTQQGQRGLGLD